MERSGPWGSAVVGGGTQNGGAAAENGLAVPQKVKHGTATWLSHSARRDIPHGTKHRDPRTGQYADGHSSTIHNSRKGAAPQTVTGNG